MVWLGGWRSIALPFAWLFAVWGAVLDGGARGSLWVTERLLDWMDRSDGGA